MMRIRKGKQKAKIVVFEYGALKGLFHKAHVDYEWCNYRVGLLELFV